MKDYKIKEQLCNMKQSIDHLKMFHIEQSKKIDELTEKFDALVEILQQKEVDNEQEV